MIESLTVENWQCHRKFKIDFDRITVFTGENDCGKSSILRALLWMFFNQWDGTADEFITWGADFARCCSTVDGYTVERYKGQGENVYVLDGSEFRAFHPNTPQAIAELLRMGPDNIQQQGDPAFWISLTSGQAASALNEIFNLSAIDNALSNVASDLRKANIKVSISKERLAKAKKTKKELNWVKDANRLLTHLEELDEKILANKREAAKLNWDLLCLQEAMQQEEAAFHILDVAANAIKVGERLIEVNRTIETLRRLTCLEEEITNLSKTLKIKESLLAKWLRGKCPLCKRGPVQ